MQMLRFILGAIGGGLTVWFWREAIRGHLDEKTHSVRARGADGIRSVEQTAEGVIDRAKTPLRRATELLEQGKTQMSSNLRSAEEAIRPRPA